jgi:hypothetical protein
MESQKAGILLRELLFADETRETVASRASAAGGDGPLTMFAAAHQAARSGDEPTTVTSLQKIVGQAGLETRVYLQAWSCLRERNVAPPPDLADKVQGMVVEVAVEDGLDIVAAYGDHSARYFNYAGGGIVWESQDGEINKTIDDLLVCGQSIADVTGIWDQARPPAPGKGMARVNALTFGGLHFGQAELSVLAADPLGGPAIRAALALMQELIARQQAPQQRPEVTGS